MVYNYIVMVHNLHRGKKVEWSLLWIFSLYRMYHRYIRVVWMVLLHLMVLFLVLFKSKQVLNNHLTLLFRGKFVEFGINFLKVRDKLLKYLIEFIAFLNLQISWTFWRFDFFPGDLIKRKSSSWHYSYWDLSILGQRDIISWFYWSHSWLIRWFFQFNNSAL